MSSGSGLAPRTTTPTDETRESPWLYAVLALLGTAGFFYVNLAAAIVDGLVGTLGFSSAQAGTVMSANIYGASLGGLVAVFAVRRWPWRRSLLWLFAALVVVEAVSMFVHDYRALLALRALDGLIGGLSVGIALSLLARTRFPDRAFGALLVFQFVFGGLGSWWLPGLVATHGTWVLFACTTAMNVAALVAAAFVKVGAGRSDIPKATGVAGGNTTRLLTAFALLALFLFQAANMGLFAFIIPLGQHYDLSLPFISRTVGLATWIGTLGAACVIVFGARMGRSKPLLLAMIVTVIGIGGFFWSDRPAIFFAANASTAVTWSFVVPYLFGIVSALDRTGRLATLAGFVSGLGLASGPLFAGWTVQPHDFVPLIATALVFFGIATVAMLLAAARVDRLGSQTMQEVT